jgi:hypothetical protein
VPVVIVIAAIVILAGVVVVAMGGGGELARDRPAAPVAGDFCTWYDVAFYRPPAALLGYDATATQRALAEIAQVVADRDAEIEMLRRRLAAAGLPGGPDLQPAAEAAEPGRLAE